LKRARGFTMVELITVMVLTGILAAFAIPRLTGDNWAAGSAFRSEVLSALRYAQKSAVSHRRLVCATVGTAAVALAIAPASGATACTTSLASPDGSAYASLDQAVRASGALVGARPLYFQPWGTITTDSAGAIPASGMIAISGQGAIRIEGETGYVE
jgi:MSHA pilin protein MshC